MYGSRVRRAVIASQSRNPEPTYHYRHTQKTCTTRSSPASYEAHSAPRGALKRASHLSSSPPNPPPSFRSRLGLSPVHRSTYNAIVSTLLNDTESATRLGCHPRISKRQRICSDSTHPSSSRGTGPPEFCRRSSSARTEKPQRLAKSSTERRRSPAIAAAATTYSSSTGSIAAIPSYMSWYPGR